MALPRHGLGGWGGPECTQIRGQSSEPKRHAGERGGGRCRERAKRHSPLNHSVGPLPPGPPRTPKAELSRAFGSHAAVDTQDLCCLLPSFPFSCLHKVNSGIITVCEYSVVFHKLTELCNCHHSPVLDHFHHPQRFPLASLQSISCPTSDPRQPLICNLVSRFASSGNSI